MKNNIEIALKTVAIILAIGIVTILVITIMRVLHEKYVLNNTHKYTQAEIKNLETTLDSAMMIINRQQLIIAEYQTKYNLLSKALIDSNEALVSSSEYIQNLKKELKECKQSKKEIFKPCPGGWHIEDSVFKVVPCKIKFQIKKEFCKE